MRCVLIAKHAELSVYRRAESPFWYAKLWNYEKSCWGTSRSTAIPVSSPKSMAERVARSLLSEGFFKKKKPDNMLIEYLRTFWGETYPALKKAQNRSLSRAYCLNNLAKIKNYVEAYPPFAKSSLEGLTVDLLEKWRTWLSTEKRISARSVNICLQAVKVPMGEALRRGLIKSNPCLSVKNAIENRREKGILSEAEAGQLIALLKSNQEDPRPLAAILLAVGCGLRRGEIRGLQWDDIQNGILSVTHNFVEKDGAKGPKCGSTGSVPVPSFVQAALDKIPRITNNPLVFPSARKPDQPIAAHAMQLWFVSIMDLIGIDAETLTRRNLTLHGLRHTFVTLLQKSGVSLIEASALARKRDTSDTLRRYTHGTQILDFETAKTHLEFLADRGA
jgi:integrase